MFFLSGSGLGDGDARLLGDGDARPLDEVSGPSLWRDLLRWLFLSSDSLASLGRLELAFGLGDSERRLCRTRDDLGGGCGDGDLSESEECLVGDGEWELPLAALSSPVDDCRLATRITRLVSGSASGPESESLGVADLRGCFRAGFLLGFFSGSGDSEGDLLRTGGGAISLSLL